MSHTCHAPGCSRLVPPRMFACKPHWYALPQAFRAAIWAEYREGQERDKRPSLRYLAVQTAARAQLAFKPFDEEAAGLCAGLYCEASAYRLAAIRNELGDPFAGLPPPFCKEPLDVPGRTFDEIMAEMRRRIEASA